MDCAGTAGKVGDRGASLRTRRFRTAEAGRKRRERIRERQIRPCRLPVYAASSLPSRHPIADTRVEIGFAIAEQQGIAVDHDNPMQRLGSYLVNANNSCNDCHTQLNYQPGGDPYSRQPKQVHLPASAHVTLPPHPARICQQVSPVPISFT